MNQPLPTTQQATVLNGEYTSAAYHVRSAVKCRAVHQDNFVFGGGESVVNDADKEEEEEQEEDGNDSSL